MTDSGKIETNEEFLLGSVATVVEIENYEEVTKESLHPEGSSEKTYDYTVTTIDKSIEDAYKDKQNRLYYEKVGFKKSLGSLGGEVVCESKNCKSGTLF